MPERHWSKDSGVAHCFAKQARVAHTSPNKKKGARQLGLRILQTKSSQWRFQRAAEAKLKHPRNLVFVELLTHNTGELRFGIFAARGYA